MKGLSCEIVTRDYSSRLQHSQSTPCHAAFQIRRPDTRSSTNSRLLSILRSRSVCKDHHRVLAQSVHPVVPFFTLFTVACGDALLSHTTTTHITQRRTKAIAGTRQTAQSLWRAQSFDVCTIHGLNCFCCHRIFRPASLGTAQPLQLSI